MAQWSYSAPRISERKRGLGISSYSAPRISERKRGLGIPRYERN